MTRKTPYPYQEEAIQRILAEPTKAALIASEVGTGKTLLATEVMLRAQWRRVLLIGITHTFPQWAASIADQSEGAAELLVMNSSKKGRANYERFLAGEAGIFAAGIQWLQAQDWAHEDKLDFEGNPIPAINKKTGEPTGKNERKRVHLKTFAKMSDRKDGAVDAIIFDEAHAVSNRNSIGRKTLMTIKSEWKIGLSATWSGNSFANAWSLPRWMWPDIVPAYWIWHEQYCKTETTYVAGGRAVETVVGEKEPEGAFVRSLPLYIKEEAEKAPPAIDVYCDPTPQQSAQFADLKEDLVTWVHSEMSSGHEPLVIDVPAVLHSRLRQVALAELSFDADGEVVFAPNAASGKLRALRGILDAWGDQPVVLFTDSRLFANLAAERMRQAGYAAEAWTGDTSAKERQRIKEDFIAGKIKYLVGTVQAMGTGLDGLQTVCSKGVWLSEPDGNPSLAEQALGRIFRPGRTLEHGEFQHVRLLQKDSLDVHVMERIVAKAKALYASTGKHVLKIAG